MELALVILAGGLSTRFGRLKQLEPVDENGYAILNYSIFDAIRSGFTQIVVITNSTILNSIQSHLNETIGGKVAIQYVLQDEHAAKYIMRSKPLGTGHALLCASEVVKSPMVVINADDFYGRSAFDSMVSHFEKNTAASAMVGYLLKNTLSKHGAVSRGICTVNKEQYLSGIEEIIHLKEINGDIIDETTGSKMSPKNIVSMNFWGFETDVFNYASHEFDRFINENQAESNNEFYITTVVRSMIETGHQVKTEVSLDRWYGLTHPEDKNMVTHGIRGLVSDGVYPKNLFE